MANIENISGIVQRETLTSDVVDAWLISFGLSVLLFSGAPQVDIAWSENFYSSAGFAHSQSSLLEGIRKAIWAAAIAGGLLCIFGTPIAFWRKSFLGITCRTWNVCVAVYLLGPGIAANLLLKTHWGRARPADIVEFGGTASFTPALLPAAQCDRNCSFVSGEAAGAAALAVQMWLFSSKVSGTSTRFVCRVLAVLIVVTGSSLRVATGRHFLSDVVFAVLIVTGIALLLLRWRGHFVYEA